MSAAPGSLVLLIEDDGPLRATLVRVLGRAGFRVEAAESAAQALAALAEDEGREIAAVVSDDDLPGMSGRELLLAVRRVRPGTAVLLVSGYDASGAAASRRIEFLPKPFSGDELVERLERLLA